MLMEGRPIIADKCDVAAAAKLVGLGYPAVEDILPELFTWIQDGNWPVAQIVAPFLASLGPFAVPEIWKILRSDDLLWKYWCILRVVSELPLDSAIEFETELWRMANSPSEAERLEEIDRVAADVLECLASRRGK
jgi:hypothetical protein